MGQTIEASENPSISHHLLYADVIRSIATILVVWTHVAGCYIYNPTGPAITSAAWQAANLMTAIGRPCVPLFVILSGVLLLKPGQTGDIGKAFWQKRFGRILIPFLLWSFIFMALRLGYNKESLTSLQILDAFVKGTISSHLWFVYMIMAMYILTPIIQTYIRSAQWRDYLYLMGLWAINCVMMPMVMFLTNYDIYIFSFFGLSGFGGYYISGAYLKQIKVPNQRRSLLILMIAIGTITTTVITAHLSQQAGKFVPYFYSYLSPNVVIQSIAAFLLLKDLPYNTLAKKNPLFIPSLKTLSTASFGIYLVHPLVVSAIESGKLGFSMTGSPVTPWIAVPICTMLVTLVSMAIAIALRKIPKIGPYLC